MTLVLLLDEVAVGGVVRAVRCFLADDPRVLVTPVIFAEDVVRRVGVQQAGEIGPGIGVRGPGDGIGGH